MDLNSAPAVLHRRSLTAAGLCNQSITLRQTCSLNFAKRWTNLLSYDLLFYLTPFLWNSSAVFASRPLIRKSTSYVSARATCRTVEIVLGFSPQPAVSFNPPQASSSQCWGKGWATGFPQANVPARKIARRLNCHCLCNHARCRVEKEMLRPLPIKNYDFRIDSPSVNSRRSYFLTVVTLHKHNRMKSMREQNLYQTVITVIEMVDHFGLFKLWMRCGLSLSALCSCTFAGKFEDLFEQCRAFPVWSRSLSFIFTI